MTRIERSTISRGLAERWQESGSYWMLACCCHAISQLIGGFRGRGLVYNFTDVQVVRHRA
jgi:hypothetical protein